MERTGQIELAALIAQYATADGMHDTGIPRLSLLRASRTSEPIHAVYEPALCIVAQGRKQVMMGDSLFAYDRAQFLIVSVDVPVVGQIVEATPETPYLCLKLDLDPVVLGSLLIDSGTAGPAVPNPGRGLEVSTVTPELLDAAVRLLRLLGTPHDIPILAPLLEREILYRLLRSDQLQRLRQIAMAEGRLQQVNRAIGWIKRNYREPFRIEAVAAEAGMSASALHQHFKSVTAMSPLQYQKQLRLQEARRLILVQAMDAATAGHNVGYDSPSQFSREYSRLFGAPPLRDVARLRTSPDAGMHH
jgi:AraC-like DNA-binding protein